jgi:CRP-like cAMP-binding protein
MSLLTGERRCATVIAQTDCEVIEIEKERMAEVLQRNPELLQQLSQLLAQRKLENERLCAGAAAQAPDRQRQQEYARGLITTLKSFFEL